MPTHPCRRRFITFSLCTLTIAIVSGMASMDSRAAEDELTVEAPYVRLAPPHAPATAAFMVIRNSGASPRTLVAAESPAAKQVELHDHVHENGMMKMRQVSDIVVPAHGQVEFKPGGLHIMLIGLNAPLKAGDPVNFTLHFADGALRQFAAPVKAEPMNMPMNMPMTKPASGEH